MLFVEEWNTSIVVVVAPVAAAVVGVTAVMHRVLCVVIAVVAVSVVA